MTNTDAERVSDIVARLRAELTPERYEEHMKAGWDKAIPMLREGGHGDYPRLLCENHMMDGKDELLAEALIFIEAQSKALAEVRMKDREITVFDWAYTDPRTGLPAYAGTPEKARKLKEIGVKLTVVYTVTPTPENPNG